MISISSLGKVAALALVSSTLIVAGCAAKNLPPTLWYRQLVVQLMAVVATQAVHWSIIQLPCNKLHKT